MLSAVAGLTLAASAATALAGAYKWVDENGNVQYTQTPPPGNIKAKTVNTGPKTDPEAAAAALKALQDKSSQALEARQEQAQTESAAASEAAEKQRICELAKKRLLAYERPRVNVVNADGTRSRATEEQRQAEISKAKEHIAKNC